LDEGYKVSMAHALITQLRIIVGFGATILDDAECRRIRSILSGLRFKTPKRRTKWITAVQADDIRDMAFGKGRAFYPFALAQALQFDCALRQKDVIREWVPLDDPAPSTIIDGSEKWVRGLVREEIDDDFVLRHQVSRNDKMLSFPLDWCEMVMEEWYAVPKSGPLIVDPDTRLPYRAWKYRRVWRRLATEAKVPKDVWNMDSRAGRITQLMAAGVNLEDARKFAGDERESTTRRNCRDDEDAIRRVLGQASGDSEEC
jgi:hypothetical protein